MKEKIVLLKKYLEKGYTQKKSAELAGLNPSCIGRTIKRNNLIVTRKFGLYRYNDNYFDIIDTENKAYLLGFLLADGYISGNRIRINNSIDDIEILDLFRKEVTPECEIKYSNKQKGAILRKKQGTVGLTSIHMTQVLREKYDIIENKTNYSQFKFNFNTIPIELQRHFIRGYFDGDGSVSFHPNKHNTVFFNFSFVFNSEFFAKQIAEIFENLFQIKRVIYYHKGKTCNYQSLRFNYNKRRAFRIKEIYDYLYQDSSVYLSRKKVKFEQYIEYRANPRRKEDRVV